MRKRNAGNPRAMLSVRVASLAKELISVEKEAHESDGEYVERMLLSSVKTEKGKELIKRRLQSDNFIRACFTASGMKLPFLEPMTCLN